MRLPDAGSLSSWRRLTPSPCVSRRLPSGLHLTSCEIPAAPVAGRRILFISDLHLRAETTWSFNPFRESILKWKGIDWIERALNEAVKASKPDLLLIGGDIAAHSCWIDPAGDMLKGLAPGIPKAAVFGNWDKRRRRWLPHDVWLDLYHRANIRLLVNERLAFGPLSVYGMDDFKLGFPRYGKPPEGTLFNCVLAHNPDAILNAVSDEMLEGIDLILCGHTHGGQWRLPFLGAVARSSAHWSGFDYGAYIHKNGRARLLVSSGIGATAINARINCPPEAVLIELV